MMVAYRINNGQQLEFYVPGSSQNMRWAAHSVRSLPSDRCVELMECLGT